MIDDDEHPIDHELLDPRRLSVTTSLLPVQDYRQILADAQDVLHRRFREGIDVRELVALRAWVIDQVLRHAWSAFGLAGDMELALLAVGGYGRGELHPHSDIDVLILHAAPNLDDELSDRIAHFLSFLWDLKLDVGSSVRALEDCEEAARSDITIATHMMESRTIAGTDILRQAMLEHTSPEHVWPGPSFFQAKWQEQRERHAKHNNTEYNLEPDIKNAPGGLRDIQMVGWVAKRHFGADTLHDLVLHGFLTEAEYRHLDTCQGLLWRIRYALHMLTDRAENRLLFDHQTRVAELFGYRDTPRQRAVEQLMKSYYRAAMEISTLNELLLQYFDESILQQDRLGEAVVMNNRFLKRGQHIEAIHDEVFRRYPPALLEIFVLMANDEQTLDIRASTIRLIMQSVDLIDDNFRADLRCITLFMELLRSPHQLFSVLRRMKRYGVLGRYIPAFGAIIGQMQYDLFHIYTVDAHTLLLIKNMRRFGYSEVEGRFPVVAKVAQSLPKIELLYLAGLFHDIGKGRGGDHSELGSKDALDFCLHHRLGSWDAHLVAWLTRHHLIMSMTAQKKDIHDPDVIHAFAQQVGDLVHLDYLYALTVADINATNPTLWNNWKASLLQELYTQTKRALRRGLAKPVDKAEWIAEKRNDALQQLQAVGIADASVQLIWEGLGDEYFMRENASDIAWHTQALIEHGNREQPLVLLKETTEHQFLGATQIFIYTRDRRNLFAATVALLDQLHLSVVDARIITSNDRFSLDTYIVLDENNEHIKDSARLERIRLSLIETLAQPDLFPDIVSRRMPRQLRHFPVATSVTLSNDLNNQHTIVEIITLDRPGLLARIGRIFMEHEVYLHNARIATLGERAEDVFFLTDENLHPIADAALCERLAQSLRQQLDQQE